MDEGWACVGAARVTAGHQAGPCAEEEFLLCAVVTELRGCGYALCRARTQDRGLRVCRANNGWLCAWHAGAGLAVTHELGPSCSAPGEQACPGTGPCTRHGVMVGLPYVAAAPSRTLLG